MASAAGSPAPSTAPRRHPELDRRTLLRGAGLLGAVGVGGALAARPDEASAASAPRALSAKDFWLTSDYSTYTDRVDALLKKGGRATVSQVMDAANLARTPSTAISGQAHGFVWDTSDNTDPDVEPQGITTSRDAVGTKDDGRFDGRQVIAVSFYNDSPKSSRINLVDWDSTHPDKYRRVLLVEPTGTADKPSFKDVPIHVGGLAWSGNYLYVADTGHGMRVFDMTKFLKLDTSAPKDQIGAVGGKLVGHTYAFALPQVGTVASHAADGVDPLVWSTISLDRVSRSIVMTEYRCESCSDYPNGKTRAVRFPLEGTSSRFAAKAQASQALEVPLFNLNGVASHNGCWWFNSSASKTLTYWPGSGAMTTHPWVSSGESISYWEDESGPDLLWTLREGAGHRQVFAVPQAKYAS